MANVAMPASNPYDMETAEESAENPMHMSKVMMAGATDQQPMKFGGMGGGAMPAPTAQIQTPGMNGQPHAAGFDPTGMVKF